MSLIRPQLNPSDPSYAARMLERALNAYQVALDASQYSTGGRQVTHQQLFQLRQEITYWQRIVSRLEAKAQGARDPGTATAVWYGRRI